MFYEANFDLTLSALCGAVDVRWTPNSGVACSIPALVIFNVFVVFFFLYFGVIMMYKLLDTMVMTPIYQELYFVYESLKTKVDQNSMVTGWEILCLDCASIQ